MKCKLFIFVILFIVSCTSNNAVESKLHDLRNTAIKPQKVYVEKLDIPLSSRLSLHAPIQNLADTLLLGMPVNSDTLLYKVYKDPSNPNTYKKEALIYKGRGPNELLDIYSSYKPLNRNYIYYYSLMGQKLVRINDDFQIIDENSQKFTTPIWDRFILEEDKLIVENKLPIEEKSFIYTDILSKEAYGFIDLRVPKGYQPAIRNSIASMIVTDNYFIYSYTGDRSLQLIPLSAIHAGEVKNTLKIQLGDDDLMEEPYKITNPFDAPSGIRHVNHMVYNKGKIYVSMAYKLFVIDEKEKTLLNIYELYTNNDSEKINASVFVLLDDESIVLSNYKEIFSLKL